MEGFSGAECVALCQNAAIHAMEEDIHIEMVKFSYLIPNIYFDHHQIIVLLTI